MARRDGGRLPVSAAPPKLDPLRERLAATELEEARALLASGGAGALVALAQRMLSEIEAARARFEELSRELEAVTEADDAARLRHIERYLRETVGGERSLAADLRALRRDARAFDLAALGERVAVAACRADLRAEAALAVARLAHGSTALDVDALLALAQTPGRWSRRTEALDLLAEVAKDHAEPSVRPAIAAGVTRLAAPTEHRWVQPVALATLAAIAPAQALELARERLAQPAAGDDFIVRSRIVELAARLAAADDSGGDDWADLVARASQDPSDLVRMSAARLARDAETVARMARGDRSHKVRAVALIALAQRNGTRALGTLTDAVVGDPNGFVVQTAAEEIVALARDHAIEAPAQLFEALALGTTRTDVDAAVRAACADALVEVDVLATPSVRSVRDALAQIAGDTPVGGSTRIDGDAFARAGEEQLGRVLAVLARDDFALGIDHTRRGVVLHRGERRGFALWRALFELRHPAPSKRQAFDHTSACKPRGALRAPPGGMAELTATRVPGERVLVDNAGGWGRHLPLVDDLLSLGVWRPRRAVLASAHGLTTLVPPPTLPARLRAWLALTLRYARFVDVRRRALDSNEPAVQTHYVTEVERTTGMSIRFAPHAFGAGADRPTTLPVPGALAGAATAEPGPSELSMLAPAGLLASDLVTTLRDTGHDLAAYAMSPGGNRLPHLAAYALALLGALVVRGVTMRQRIERDRRSIPLVIGGWGTRGKSGTERIKAAMFQGLGYECLVKTTGCEAMFIHAIPGIPAREVFIYRPYDKASIWEQRDVLELARRMQTRVFLWECMALQPDLVGLLQSQWMRDDCSTITNAYPDHEDVQGPTGTDVATVISEFVPSAGQLFTSEEQMLPILRERAKERGTTLQVVSARDAELIADDLLARFPYQEHPKNIALVASLARGLGVSPVTAIVEMADNVVPDLGVLKTYPTVPWRGRTLSFTNGMSANERAGALANWRRSGFDKHDPDADPARWTVTVVNNRADRVARSEVFARFIVEDTAAHRHVLIGTNVSGLLGFIAVALERHLDALSPTRNLGGDAAARLRTARARIVRAFARLEVGAVSADSVVAECRALDFPAVDGTRIETLLVASDPREGYEAAKSAVRTVLSGLVGEGEHLPFLVTMVARRRLVRSLDVLVETTLVTDAAVVEGAFRTAYRELFDEALLPLHDPALSGDAIIERIASSVPPGARATIMGVQNIKGTGLDFVYRWVSIDMVDRALGRLSEASHDERERALLVLMMHDDYGLVDASLALAAVERAREADPSRNELPWEAIAKRLRDVIALRTKALAAGSEPRIADRARKIFGETFDFLDAMRRRRLAGHLLDELVAGRVSHAAAARRMRGIVARTKGAWMRKADP